MAKRNKGQKAYESEHPDRPWMPDVPGHQQKRGVVVNKEAKQELEDQIEKLRKELGVESDDEARRVS